MKHSNSEKCISSKTSPKLIKCKHEGNKSYLTLGDQKTLHGNSGLCVRAPPSAHLLLREQDMVPKEP